MSSHQHVDLSTPEFDELFLSSPVYDKFSIVPIHRVEEEQEIETVLSSGAVETTKVAQVGEYIVTNPGGERYVISEQKFKDRYIHVEGDNYQAKGSVRVVRNTTGLPVRIIAPWGSPQYGDVDCLFAVAVGENTEDISGDRYIIEDQAFTETYAVRS